VQIKYVQSVAKGKYRVANKIQNRRAQELVYYTIGGDAMREVIVFHGEDGYWVVECPSLPGCISQGETKEEAITNIKEAIEGYILALQEDGLSVPEEHFEAMVVAV
jgi:predicted RNase H-like HicB family nuclease